MRKSALLILFCLGGCLQQQPFTQEQVKTISEACVNNGGYVTQTYTSNGGVTQFECASAIQK